MATTLEDLRAAVHGTCKQLSYADSELHRWARAFDTIGNHDMSRNLSNLGRALSGLADDLGETYSKYLNDQFKESTAQVGRTLSALVDAGSKG